MKKNLLKVVSFLSVGSILGLILSSCTSLSNSVEQKPVDPINRQPELNTGEQTKRQLNNLIDSQPTTLQMYEDYKNIRNTLNAAYQAARIISDSNNSTPEQLEAAIVTLRNAIGKASADKTAFNNQHSELVMAYNRLKAQMQSASLIISSLNEEKYSAIKTNITPIYDQAKVIIANTLQSFGQNEKATITNIENITQSISKLVSEKQNADEYAVFKRFDVKKENLIGTFAKTGPVPEEYSFVAYSANINNYSYNFATPKIWVYPHEITNRSEGAIVSNSSELTNVGWIYSLTPAAQAESKYEFNFEYYGPSSVAYLYFPYKSINSLSNRIVFDYLLNHQESSDNSFRDHLIIPTPSVDSISVIRLPITNLRYGMNTITLRSHKNLPFPVVGNMYLSSAPDGDTNALDKIYNDIFGNIVSPDNPREITVDVLKAYGLASSSTIVMRQFNPNVNNKPLTLDGVAQNKPYYLIGNLGGSDQSGEGASRNALRTFSPNTRTYTFYVNAPQAGSYNISGIYNSSDSRGLEFKTTSGTGQAQSTSVVKITNLSSGSTDAQNILKTFDTAKTETTTVEDTNRVLTLTKGLNKILVTGLNSQAAPNLGNITFRLAS
ncbi:VlhA.2.01 variable lipoprotein family protein [Mycoplasmoides gallisepticum str. R(low)]|uniref:VlhA.2.01 variable lipoprotein family protein n=2 Tax=Mycoplasmoides gallisepticum TaxID=2096 RepID=Q7NB25_MYCGA|nr:FIVAR domain-containing protein [Mycoplasmoides gallisepticum]AAP56805.2 VlhA.2.01 variable lipoprotein family protein [Mycoplasmoides gallisepticum str. R(low)]ADC30661.1 VlhA.2.01 variable lipoprotein family protein [Mycoplasmoides gallisepticum str. R(high)]